MFSLLSCGHFSTPPGKCRQMPMCQTWIDLNRWFDPQVGHRPEAHYMNTEEDQNQKPMNTLSRLILSPADAVTHRSFFSPPRRRAALALVSGHQHFDVCTWRVKESPLLLIQMNWQVQKIDKFTTADKWLTHPRLTTDNSWLTNDWQLCASQRRTQSSSQNEWDWLAASLNRILFLDLRSWWPKVQGCETTSKQNRPTTFTMIWMTTVRMHPQTPTTNQLQFETSHNSRDCLHSPSKPNLWLIEKKSSWVLRSMPYSSSTSCLSQLAQHLNFLLLCVLVFSNLPTTELTCQTHWY